MDAPLGRVYGNEAHRQAREAAAAAQVEAAARAAEAAARAAEEIRLAQHNANAANAGGALPLYRRR